MDGASVLFTLFLAATATAPHPSVSIKNFGIFGPVTGGNETPGRVDLEITGAMLTPVISLQSSNPGVASVPATARPTVGYTAIFMVKVEPVVSTTEVTITATVGQSVKTATLTILPPKLAMLACDQPANVYPTKPLPCTVWLDGKAAETANIQLATSAPHTTIPFGAAMLPKGLLKTRFQVYADPIAQSVSGSVSATYAGVTKSTPITVMPVALKDFSSTM